MKQVAFAWVTFLYDFDTLEKAEEYYKKNRFDEKKHWLIEEPYENGVGGWTVEVKKPYKDYNPGW